MDIASSDFPDDLRPIIAAEIASVVGSYSPRYPSNPMDRATAGFVQAACRKLGHEVSIGEAAALWESYLQAIQDDWPDDAYTTAGAQQCLRLFCEYQADQRP